MLKKTTWRWARFGLISSLVSAVSFPVATVAQDEELEPVFVTGSRISRIDLEGPLPVEVFSRQDIQSSGFTSLGDYLATLPQNSGFINPITEGASFTRGANTLNIRGLGANRFLTLVNGRRVAPYALLNSNQALVFDFNSIAPSAIESIEYLKEGASAIYGSDAMVGVIDIKLRRDFEGLSTGLTIGNTTGHDTLYRAINAVVGTRSGSTSIMVAASYQDSKDSFMPDYSRSQSANYSNLGNRGIDLRSAFNYPANVVLTDAQAEQAFGTPDAGGPYRTSNADGTANPAIGDFVAGQNRFEFAPFIQIYPEYKYMSFYSMVKHEINDDLYAFGEFSMASNTTDYTFTPAVVNATTTFVPSTGTTLIVPADNPFNPFGFDLGNLQYRTSFLPSRTFLIESVAPRALIGLGGNAMDWSWEAGMSYSYNQVTDTAGNAIRADDLQAALSGTTVDTAINPFGPTPNQALLNDLLVSSISTSKVEVLTFDFNATGELVDLAFGTLSASFGGEYREEKLSDRPDQNSYVGSGGGTGFEGSRDVSALYAEFLLPVNNVLEFSLAARYEDYSDFGDTFKPKAGFSVRPSNWLLFRASYSESFKAPELGRLYTSRQESFTASPVQDPENPGDAPQQYLFVTGGNPNLAPEEGRSIYAGVVIDVPGVENLTFELDYLDFKIKDVIVDIRTLSTTFILNNADLFPGVIQRGPDGRITSINAVPQNQALERYRGLDFTTRYRWDVDNVGTFRATLRGTRLVKVGRDAGIGQGFNDTTGGYPNPKYRANFDLRWDRGDWGASVFVDYIGGFIVSEALDWKNSSFIRVNPSVRYRGLWDTEITVGATNVFNSDPPRDGYEIEGYDTGFYNGQGRFLYMSINKDF